MATQVKLSARSPFRALKTVNQLCALTSPPASGGVSTMDPGCALPSPGIQAILQSPARIPRSVHLKDRSAPCWMQIGAESLPVASPVDISIRLTAGSGTVTVKDTVCNSASGNPPITKIVKPRMAITFRGWKGYSIQQSAETT